MYYKLLVLAVIGLFCFNIPSVTSILCYQCNSNNNSACTHLEDNGTIIKPKPCLEYGEGDTTYYLNFTEEEVGPAFCRKVDLLYTNMEGDDVYRTIRGCGYIKSSKNRTSYKIADDCHEEYQYQCYTDGCNGATTNFISIFSTISPLIIFAGLFSSDL